MAGISMWVRRWGGLAALATGLVLALGLLADEAFWREPRSLALAYVQVRTPAWPAGTGPLRVVFLSDLHADRAHMPPERVRRLVLTANALSPDLIVLGGDYVGGLWDEGGSRLPRARRSSRSNQAIEEGLAALAGLKARYGAVAVLGNHDGWWSADRATALLQGVGIRVLRNAGIRLRRPDGDVWVVGLDDAIAGRPNLASAMAGAPHGVAILGVAHEPGQFYATPGLPVLLAGHTHGGQVRLPWLGAVVHRSPFINAGFDQPVVRGGRVLVVTRGLGESGLPARFGSPPEIMLVEIGPGPQASGRRLS